jgi:hypothetical protein
LISHQLLVSDGIMAEEQQQKELLRELLFILVLVLVFFLGVFFPRGSSFFSLSLSLWVFVCV